jgi:hypothetical protein
VQYIELMQQFIYDGCDGCGEMRDETRSGLYFFGVPLGSMGGPLITPTLFCPHYSKKLETSQNEGKQIQYRECASSAISSWEARAKSHSSARK